MAKTLKVALVQHACTDDRAHNLANAVEGIRTAAAAGARLVLLQELHSNRYFCQTEDPSRFDLAEPIPGPAVEQLGALAREFGIVIVGSLFERRARGLYHNTAVVLDCDGSLAGRYRKMHIPDDPGYHEKFYFAPGDQGFVPVRTSVASLGVLVCWDQWYPEAARLMALHGADMLLYPSAIGWDPDDDIGERKRQLESWVTIQRAHAIANALPVLTCNRTGFEPRPGGAGGIEFWGSSFVAGPQGEVLARAAADAPQVLLADIDLGRTETLRRLWPFLRDRRIDAYSDLNVRYGS
jgi:N-carbamoylputrescine amidase